MKKRGEVVQDLDGEWRNGKILSGRQMDGHSCGPFVLMVFFSFIPSSKYWRGTAYHNFICQKAVKIIGEVHMSGTKHCLRMILSRYKLMSTARCKLKFFSN